MSQPHRRPIPAPPAGDAPSNDPRVLDRLFALEERVRGLEERERAGDARFRALELAAAAPAPSAPAPQVPAQPVRPQPRGPARTVEEHAANEKTRILSALEATGWNVVKAAEAVGIPRRTFYRRMKDYGIQ